MVASFPLLYSLWVEILVFWGFFLVFTRLSGGAANVISTGRALHQSFLYVPLVLCLGSSGGILHFSCCDLTLTDIWQETLKSSCYKYTVHIYYIYIHIYVHTHTVYSGDSVFGSVFLMTSSLILC